MSTYERSMARYHAQADDMLHLGSPYNVRHGEPHVLAACGQCKPACLKTQFLEG